MRRVAITGVGAISALGRNAAEFAEALRQGRPGIGPIECTDCSQLRFQNGAEVRGYSHQPYFDDRRADFMDRFAQFAVIAAREAVECAGVAWTAELRESAAIVTGSCVGGQGAQDAGFTEVYKLGRNRVHPLTIPRTMANAGASHISMEFGITGPSLHDFHGLLLRRPRHRPGVLDGALRRFRTGHQRRQRGALQLWDTQGLGSHARGIARHLPAVFQGPPRHDSGRRRGHAGAGAARSRAGPRRADSRRDRGVRHVRRRFAHHPAFRRGRGARHARGPQATRPSRPSRSATSTRTARPLRPTTPPRPAAIRAVFGAHADRLAVSSTKSMHGHALGAAAALECLATALALRDGVLPPTANYNLARPGVRPGCHPQPGARGGGGVRHFELVRVRRD